MVREYRTFSDGSFSLLGEHAVITPAGLFGGYPGAPARFEVVRDSETAPISPQFGSKATAFPLKAGDIIRIRSQGGGGWGNPLERDVERVLEDVLDEKVSDPQARGVYGVVVDHSTSSVDMLATTAMRAGLASARLSLDAERGGAPSFQGGVRVSWMGEIVARRVGNGAGDLAEAFAPDHPTPLRFRIGVRTGPPDDVMELDEEAWRDLELREGQPLLVRSIYSGHQV